MTTTFMYIIICIIGVKCNVIRNDDYLDFDANLEIDVMHARHESDDQGGPEAHIGRVSQDGATSNDVIHPENQDHIRSERSPGKSPDYGKGLGGPVAAGPPGPPGPICGYVSMKHRILTAIKNGHDHPPQDYQYLATLKCKDVECRDHCDQIGCNYYASYIDPRKKEHMADFYLVLEKDLLKSANYVHSEKYDSNVQICQGTN